MNALPLAPLAALLGASLVLLAPPSKTRLFGVIACSGAFVSFGFSVLTFWQVITGRGHPFTLVVFQAAKRTVQIGFGADLLSVAMAVLVSLISVLVIAYAVAYMEDEEATKRFFVVMSVFVAGMLALVLANDYLLLYLSWEIVGFCSYMLIGHHTAEPAASTAAFKAFLVTRIGDIGLLLSIALMFLHFGSIEFDQIFGQVKGGAAPTVMTAIALLLLMGALGKSAQFPFHIWLPDAMAGPTPVSALLHSATMVAAGIYLLARSFPILAAVPEARTLLLVLCTITAFVGALAACVQTDIKRLLAYSTISQIAEMGLALAIAVPSGSVLHLITHAGFKALLFMAAGIAAKSAGSNELSRIKADGKMVRWSFLLAALSLSAIPPFGGFWSKEAMSFASSGWLAAVYIALGFLSAFYIGRAYLLAFAREQAPNQSVQNAWFRVSLVLMAGFVLLTPVLALVLANRQMLASEPMAGVRFDVKAVLSVGAAISGWLVAIVLYRRETLEPRTGLLRLPALGKLASKGFGTEWLTTRISSLSISAASLLAAFESRTFDRIATAAATATMAFARASSRADITIFDRFATGTTSTVSRLAQVSSQADEKIFDAGITEGAVAIGSFGSWVRVIQTGRIYHYLAAVFLWVLVVAITAFLVRL